MQDTNIIWDSAKERRIDYDLIDRLNREAEAKARKSEIEERLAGKRKEKEEEKEEPAAEPIPRGSINYTQTPDELREIKGNYSLQKGIYTIDFEIIVSQLCGLVLEPGVQLYFTKDAGITCKGKFEAKGKNGLEVLLTAKNKEEGWKNLYLKGGAEGIIDYAKFRYGKGRKGICSDISGGAVLIEAENKLKPSITINNSCFEMNSTGYGGAIYSNQGNITLIKNNLFLNNSAKVHGGAIYSDRGHIAIKEKNKFKNNFAEWDGGVIYVHKGSFDIDESKNTFIGNKPNNISQE